MTNEKGMKSMRTSNMRRIVSIQIRIDGGEIWTVMIINITGR